MGRKDDEEDLIETPSEKSENDVVNLERKCKPLNIHLNRLDVSSNGVVYLQNRSEQSNTNDDCLQKKVNEIADDDSVENIDNDDNNDPTEAETIKKIKEFIAMGRCEVENTKEVSTSQSVKTPMKRKMPQSEDTNKTLKKNPSLENLTLELDLTLEDEVENENDKDAGSKVISKDVSGSTDSSNSTSKIKEKKEKEVKKQEIATPSRMSKRIQSKPIKFSVKKMLRGDDVNVLRRIIPGYESEEGKKVSVKQELFRASNFKEEDQWHESVITSNTNILNCQESSRRENTPASQSPVCEESQLAEALEKVVEEDQNDRLKSIMENKDSILALSNSIEKLAVGNGKITVELKGSQQKKVVRIAVPPQQSKPSPNASLGPDIIIKRVKPLKKTFTLPEKSKVLRESLSSTSTLSKRNETDREVPSSSSSKIVHITPRIFVERISTPKTRGDLLLFHKKNIFPRFKQENKEIKSVRKSIKRRRRRRKPVSKDSSDEYDEQESSCSPNPQAQEEEKENIDGTEERIDIKPESPIGSLPSPSLPQNEPKSENAIVEEPIPPNEKLPSPAKVKEEKKKPEGRPRGRPPKAANLANLAAAKAKEMPATKNTIIPKSRYQELLVEKSLQTDVDMFSTEKKKNYENLFDNYFHTYERLVEHNDSLDSDSSDGYDDYFTHFLRLNKNKVIPDDVHRIDDKVETEISVYDLMNDISLELPGWNIHIPSDGKGFCFAQIDIVDSVPHMKKAIEMDLEYNAKVYVNGTLQKDYSGSYKTYEDIQQLIYDVDIL